MTVKAERRWYWLDAPAIGWVRQNLPDATIQRAARVAAFGREWTEHFNVEVISFARGGLTRARRAGLKPQEAKIETVCCVCTRSYMPHFEDDPCIAGLPGVRFACCGHGEESGGYILFENGLRVAISGPGAISRRITKPSEDYRAVPPSDPRFWDGAD